VNGKTIVALGLGFPRTDEKEEKIYYRINLIELKNILPFDPVTEFEGDEDDES
jgi:hypothetical protein